MKGKLLGKTADEGAGSGRMYKERLIDLTVGKVRMYGADPGAGDSHILRGAAFLLNSSTPFEGEQQTRERIVVAFGGSLCFLLSVDGVCALPGRREICACKRDGVDHRLIMSLSVSEHRR